MGAPIDLNLLRTFALVHTCGSFSAAAQQLGVPRSTVSRAISSLEDTVGQLLFHRTTRQVTTTRAGRALFDRVEPWLIRLEASLEDLPEAASEPSGILRISASADIGPFMLADAVARYTARYPDVQVEVSLSSRLVDLRKEGFDLALRYARAAGADGTLVARKIGSVALQLFAAPDYLARRGSPRALPDLREHNLVAIGSVKRLLPGRTAVTTDDKFFARSALRAGAGIGLLPAHLASEDIELGKLARVLPSFEIPLGNIQLVIPSRRHVPVKVTAFRELLVDMLRRRTR